MLYDSAHVQHNHDSSAWDQGETQTEDDAIAIIGMGCRLPGGCSSPEKLWNLLHNGESAHCKVPQWRYNAQAFYHPDRNRPGAINSTGGYFIQEDVKLFENNFFGINNVEAMDMDPQQRKLLEVVFECFESAGVTLQQLSGANVGCYVANFTLDYLAMQWHDAEYASRHIATGASPTILANRISHVFDLRGPSFVLDTACSSSLYAIHTACTALKAKDCDSAVVASANLIQSPLHQMVATRAGILSDESTCRTFDASADGYGRSEGVGALYLERLSDALRRGDPIRGIIRGTSVNSNGHTNGIMLPNAQAQERVIRQAYARARIPLNETDYIETHGTGTAVGDPIEVEALAKVFSHKSGRPTLIGSVKTNLGHSEANSGISSVIKAVLAIENQTIPPTIGIRTINPKIVAFGDNIKIVREPTKWPESRLPRVSVNSFGFGGANGHAIIESAQPYLQPSQSHPRNLHPGAQDESVPLGSAQPRRKMLLPLSAHTDYSLKQRLEQLCKMDVSQYHSGSVGSIAYTLANRRSRHPKRGYMIVEDLVTSNCLLTHQKTLHAASSPSAQPSIAFVFTGQGAQWPRMGKELYLSYSVFRDAMDELDRIIASLSDGRLPSLSSIEIDEDLKPSVDINRPDISQVFCTAVQIALTDLLHDWNIVPSAVVGHSSGEIAAAYAAKMLSKTEAMIVAFYRGVIVSDRPRDAKKGSMVAAGIDADSAVLQINRLGLQEKSNVACVNSPSSTTISGDADAIEAVKAELDSQGVFNRSLATNGTAYHSHHMRGIVGQEYEARLSEHLSNATSNLDPNTTIKMISSVDSQIVDRSRIREPGYWRENLENTVQFDDAIRKLFRGDSFHVIEVGPHPALQMPIKQTLTSIDDHLGDLNEIYTSTLVRGQDSSVSMLELAGKLFVRGFEPNFDRINRLEEMEKTVFHALPTYPWNYQDSAVYREPRSIEDIRNRRYPRHELLGSQVTGGDGHTLTWRNKISTNEIKWLKDHRIGTTMIFPGTAFLAMAIEALSQVETIQSPARPAITLRDVKIVKALRVPEDGTPFELFTELCRLSLSDVCNSEKWWQFKIVSFHENHNAVHATGAACTTDTPLSSRLKLSEARMGSQPKEAWFQKLKDAELMNGPSFESIESIHFDRLKQQPVAITKLPQNRGFFNECTSEYEYSVHPAAMDAMLQTAIFAATCGRLAQTALRFPVAIQELSICATNGVQLDNSASWKIASEVQKLNAGTILAASELYDVEGQVLVQMKNVRMLMHHTKSSGSSYQTRIPALRICWKPDIDLMLENSPDCLLEYIGSVRKTSRDSHIGEQLRRTLLGCLDLFAHKQPRMKVLTLCESASFGQSCLRMLGVDSDYQRFEVFHQAIVGPNGTLSMINTELCRSCEPAPKQPVSSESLLGRTEYDLVLVHLPPNVTNESSLQTVLASFPLATTLVLSSSVAPIALPTESKRQCVELEFKNSYLTIARTLPERSDFTQDVYLVGRKMNSDLNRTLTQSLCHKLGVVPKFVPFRQIDSSTLPPKAIVIVTVEYDAVMLDRMSPQDLSRFQHITQQASCILWITHGNIVCGHEPEAALVFGLSRAIMAAQPAVQMICYDVEHDSSIESASRHITSILTRTLTQKGFDKEFAEYNGLVHVSRVVSDDDMNVHFRARMQDTIIPTALENLGRVEMTIKEAGQLDTLRFQPCSSLSKPLADDKVEIEAKCYGMNAKDLYLLNAKFDDPNQSCSNEFSGVIKRVGPSVKGLSIGDRVVVMAPGKYRNIEVVPEWACGKILPQEDYQSVTTLPLVFCTALYALKHIAKLQSGESVLIHSGAGGLGIAAIQIAKMLGAEIFTTTSTSDKRRYLVDTFGIPNDCIFDSRSSSFLPDILSKTSGRGVDVVLNSLTGDLLHQSFDACARFGRFIELGKKDILDNGKLSMGCFARNLSFTAFDLMDFYKSGLDKHKVLWRELMDETLDLFRAEKIHPIQPMAVFDASQITEAFRYFAQPERMGKVVVSMQDSSCMVQLQPSRYVSRFSTEKTYLMVGCFGGLGRSITRWMLSLGARKFVFLSRSGTSRLTARQLMDDIAASGGDAKVVVGDVRSVSDVNTAVAAASSPIGGVIQASMEIRALNWEALSHEDWMHGIDAKVQGSWNLHNSLKTMGELDFFLMLSSVSGSIGSPTEPNYCAANAFMDNFARFRRSQGLTATSLAFGTISEVGYVHEHSQTEQNFDRLGLQRTNEEEMLKLVDMGLTESHVPQYERNDPFVRAHLLTGLELQVATSQIVSTGSSALEDTLRDPRLGILAGHVAREVNAAGGSTLGDTSQLATAQGQLSPEVQESLRCGKSLEDAISSLLSRRIGKIIMLPEEKVKMDESLPSFGMDSLLVSELRNYVFQSTGVDLPFMMLLSKDSSVEKLARRILDDLDE